MSMSSMQIEGLREAANCLDEIGISTGYDTTASAFIAHDMSERMRSAAYTIEDLRDRLHWIQRAGIESNYEELFGTPERAARTLARMCAIGDGSCAGCPMFKANLEHCKSDYTHLKSIVEWLSGDVE